MLGNTPMMKQYASIKQENPDAILFFRLGDFYEMFGQDAEIASRELGITLTGRDAGMEKRVPMCGIPYHAADNYIVKLIDKGYKIAICEQVEDPKKCKGIVKREVIRIITPGTNLDVKTLEKEKNNYLVSIYNELDAWGLAICDVSTGDFLLSEFNDERSVVSLKNELYRLNPVEILLPKEIEDTDDYLKYQRLLENLDTMRLTYLNKNSFNYEKSKNILVEHFNTPSLKEISCDNQTVSVISAGVIIEYLSLTQKTPPNQIKYIRINDFNTYMQIDSMSFRNMELTRTIRSHEKKGSLLDVLDYTKSAHGARLLRQWLERPLTVKDAIEERLNAVSEIANNWSIRQDIRKNLAQVYDMERLMTRILYKRAQPKELIGLKQSLAILIPLKKCLTLLSDSLYFYKLNVEFDTLTDIYNLLERALENDPPFNIKDGGVIKCSYNESIDSFREARQNGKEWIASLENQEKEKTGIKSLKVGFNKVFGYYFEVTKANYSLVPDYFQRKQTLANSERFVTEELIRLENQVLGAEEKLLALEEELYDDILIKVGSAVERIQKTSYILAQIDVIQSLAETAVQNNYVKPQIVESNENILKFDSLRHPVVEKVLPEANYVPNDLEITIDKNLYIITGPNMGGKSTFCRSIAHAVIMAQVGSFVPAKTALIAIRDKIFARVGANDDLSSGQSTFMVEMNEVANILNNATENSLVILDEVGRGTSTYDGLSMAWAVCEYLVENIKAKTLFATHYHELTQLEKQFPSIENLSVAVKEMGDEIIFLHKIVKGPADKSYGIQVGQLAGLPEPIIERAKTILFQLEKDQLDSDINIAHTTAQVHEKTINDKAMELFNVLYNIDVQNTTPIEALNILFDLNKKLKEDGLAAK